MHARTDLPLTVRTFTALVLTLLLVLVVQAWASLRLRELVSHPALAEDLPRLVGLPLLFLLAWLLLRWDRQQPARLFLRLPPAPTGRRCAGGRRPGTRGRMGTIDGSRCIRMDCRSRECGVGRVLGELGMSGRPSARGQRPGLLLPHSNYRGVRPPGCHPGCPGTSGPVGRYCRFGRVLCSLSPAIGVHLGICARDTVRHPVLEHGNSLVPDHFTCRVRWIHTLRRPVPETHLESAAGRVARAGSRGDGVHHICLLRRRRHLPRDENAG